jgi:hypothetical protein
MTRLCLRTYDETRGVVDGRRARSEEETSLGPAVDDE